MNNSTLECTSEVKNYLPSRMELFYRLGTSGWIVLGFSSLALILIICIFIANMYHVLRHVHTDYRLPTIFVLSTYPVVGFCLYLEIIYPRANFILDNCAKIWVVFCMLQFFRLTIAYYGGEKEFVEALEGQVLPWRGIPCCFWPCVWPCLPKTPINKSQVRLLRILILQHPFVQTIFSVMGCTLYVEKLYDPVRRFSPTNIFLYISVITAISLLFALWAFVITFKASRMRLTEFKIGGKFVSFQLCLLFFRFQGFIFKLILIPVGVFPCMPPVSPTVISNLTLSSLVLGQLVVLSVLANHFYKISEADKIDYVQNKSEYQNSRQTVYSIS